MYTMTPPDLLFEFTCLQLPTCIVFGMAINYSQALTFENGGLHLKYPVFSHGQLHVDCSHVSRPSVLFFYTTNNVTTKNIIFQKAIE